MRQPFAPDLYLVTDRGLCANLGVERVVAAAVAGGVTMVQLRDDETSTAELVGLARRLVELLTPTGVPLLVNNRIEVAVAAAAAGAHVGQADAAPAEVRDRLGSSAILGLSITALDQVAAVATNQVDYLGVGPIFATGTKVDAAQPMGLQGLAAVRARIRLPIVAIGGIDRTNAASVIGAGADGIAVVSAICAATEPMAAARDLAQLVADARNGGAKR